MGGPNAIYRHASRRRFQLGKVMWQRYPGLVGGINLVSPSCVVPRCPRLGGVCVATMLAGMSRVDIGATHDMPLRGKVVEVAGGCHAVDWFCRNVVGPPEWDQEAMSSVVWVQCTTSAECIFYRYLRPQSWTQFIVGHTVRSTLTMTE